jgi:hypothetical protein
VKNTLYYDTRLATAAKGYFSQMDLDLACKVAYVPQPGKPVFVSLCIWIVPGTITNT